MAAIRRCSLLIPRTLRFTSGFNTFHTNLLTIPSAILFILNNLGLSFSSKRFKDRLGIASLGSWWQFIFLIVLVVIPDGTNKWAKWAILSLLLAYPYAHPILVSMQSMVSQGDASSLPNPPLIICILDQ